LGVAGRGTADPVAKVARGKLIGVALVNWGVLEAIHDEDNVRVYGGHVANFARPVVTEDQGFKSIEVEVRFTTVGDDDRKGQFPELIVVVIGAHALCVGGDQGANVERSAHGHSAVAKGATGDLGIATGP